VQELASWTIWTVEVFVEPLALLGLVVLVHVCSLLELVGAVGERTSVTVLAGSVQLPEFTDLSFKLEFERLSWLTVGIPVDHGWRCDISLGNHLRISHLGFLAMLLFHAILSLLQASLFRAGTFGIDL